MSKEQFRREPPVWSQAQLMRALGDLSRGDVDMNARTRDERLYPSGRGMFVQAPLVLGHDVTVQVLRADSQKKPLRDAPLEEGGFMLWLARYEDHESRYEDHKPDGCFAGYRAVDRCSVPLVGGGGIVDLPRAFLSHAGEFADLVCRPSFADRHRELAALLGYLGQVELTLADPTEEGPLVKVRLGFGWDLGKHGTGKYEASASVPLKDFGTLLRLSTEG